MFQERHPFW